MNFDAKMDGLDKRCSYMDTQPQLSYTLLALWALLVVILKEKGTRLFFYTKFVFFSFEGEYETSSAGVSENLSQEACHH